MKKCKEIKRTKRIRIRMQIEINNQLCQKYVAMRNAITKLKGLVVSSFLSRLEKQLAINAGRMNWCRK